MSAIFRLDRLKTPIGIALLVTDDDGVLRALDWEDYEPRMRELLRLQYGAVELKDARAPAGVKAALSAYFKGDLDRLGEIAWRVAGTPFQRKVWTALPKIPRRLDHELWRAGGEARRAPRDARGRTRQRLESDFSGRALSPPDRRQWFAGEVWRRARAQALAAAA